MSSERGNAPAWLFSFVDLAFLLLIAMTQLGSEDLLDLGEIIVPRIQDQSVIDLSSDAGKRWQLRVHPPSGVSESPFELIRVAGDESPSAGVRLTDSELRERLAAFQASREPKPLLVPHQDSRSQDLLEAVGLIEEFWPHRRRAAVAPALAL